VNRTAADRTVLFALLALLLAAFACGGGGSRFGLANLAVQLTAFVALALAPGPSWRFWNEAPRTLRLLILATLLLPIAQVIPLPESLWAALPGHDLAARSLDAAGGSGWTTWSVNPLRTLLALSALVTPLAVLMVGWSTPDRHLMLAAWLVVALGILTTLMGLVQLNPAGGNLTLFGVREPGAFLVGTFANRNSTALLLVFALTLVGLLPAPTEGPAVLAVRVALGLLLMVAVVLTKSRTGLVLALIPLALAALRAWGWALRERAPARGARLRASPIAIALAATLLGALAIGGLVATAPSRVGEALERFEAKNDPRRYIWEDAGYAIDRYWPTGAGMGNFDEVFQIDESLENLTNRTAGRAHNDYIEIAIEGGIPAIALAALWIVLTAFLAVRAGRCGQRAWTGWAGAAFLLAIALQSITDYPLRNQTILALGGFALLLLARSAAEGEGKGRHA
jgi:O-antigen ligase